MSHRAIAVTGKLTLPARLRAAADTLEELSALAGYKHLSYIGWNADCLRREADVLDKETL